MKVLIVCNSFFLKGNGLAASARTTAHYLREAGVEVKILSMNNLDPEVLGVISIFTYGLAKGLSRLADEGEP